MVAKDYARLKLEELNASECVSDASTNLKHELSEALSEAELASTQYDGNTRYCGPRCAFNIGELLGVNILVLTSSDEEALGVTVSVSLTSHELGHGMSTLSSTVILWLQGDHWRAVVATQPMTVLLDRTASLAISDTFFVGTLISPRLVPCLPIRCISPANVVQLAHDVGVTSVTSATVLIVI